MQRVGSGHPLTEGRIFDPRVPNLSRIDIKMTIDITMPYDKLFAVCYLGTLGSIILPPVGSDHAVLRVPFAWEYVL